MQRVQQSYYFAGADAFSKFEGSAWGRKLAKRKAKSVQTDFQRHTAMVAKKQRSRSAREKLGKLRKEAGL